MKKIGFIILTVVLAIGILGVAYARWTQQINVNGYVNTGSVSAQFAGTDVTPSNPPTVFADSPNNWAYYQTSGNGSGTLSVTLDNAYPGMTATVPVIIENNGTIPIGSIGQTVDLGNLPSDAVINVTGLEKLSDTAPLAVSGTIGASINVSIPDSETNNTFAQSSTGVYNFSIALVSTQAVPQSTVTPAYP
jgi:hypothetical protein